LNTLDGKKDSSEGFRAKQHPAGLIFSKPSFICTPWLESELRRVSLEGAVMPASKTEWIT
jgi:hypothetical protein